MADTYGKLAEIIVTAYYKAVRNDDANYSLRHVAEFIAQEVAYQAKVDAIEQDRLGESVYANDQFITTYNGLTIAAESATNRRYIAMPNQPAGLPQGRELAYIGFTGNSTLQVIPMRNKDLFMQQMTNTPKFMILAYIEGGNIYFYNLSTIVTGTVDLKLVGSVPIGSELVNLPLNLPKNVESVIVDKVLARMNAVRGVFPDVVNDDISK
jgi:hypothetical protein